MAWFGGNVVERDIACERCGLAYRHERLLVRSEFLGLYRRQGTVVERGLCGGCWRRRLEDDARDRRDEAWESYKVKYRRGRLGRIGYVQGMVAVQRRPAR